MSFRRRVKVMIPCYVHSMIPFSKLTEHARYDANRAILDTTNQMFFASGCNCWFSCFCVWGLVKYPTLHLDRRSLKDRPVLRLRRL